ncbi:YeeE/YedE thiosulfate transporter family protein, partial [Klebsiella pneumoniae]|uniref:YeeE/YedE thiosulfate transporter family protein n=1 Tax=Klebsiella pneumoniae TaxID=573 RepID=UPI0027314C1C
LLAWPSSLESGRVGGLGISGPSAQLFSLITEGKTGFFGWAGYLLIGIFGGALVAALGRQELGLRSPGLPNLVKSLFGGGLMGIGSGLAGGCM